MRSSVIHRSLPSESRPRIRTPAKVRHEGTRALNCIHRSLGYPHTSPLGLDPPCYHCRIRLPSGKHGFRIRIAVFFDSFPTLPAAIACDYVLSPRPHPFYYFYGCEIPRRSSPVALYLFYFILVPKVRVFSRLSLHVFSVCSCRRSCIRLSLTFGLLAPIVCIGVGTMLDYT